MSQESYSPIDLSPGRLLSALALLWTDAPLSGYEVNCFPKAIVMGCFELYVNI